MSIAITFLAWLGFVVAAIGTFLAVSILFSILWGATFGRAGATDLPRRGREPDPIFDGLPGTSSTDAYWNDPAFWHLHRAHMDAGLTFGEAHKAALEEYVPGARREPLTSWNDDPYSFGEWPVIKPGFDQ